MKRITLLAIFAALGLAAALGLTAKPALAWDIANLPAPYTVSGYTDVSAAQGTCQTFYVVTWYGQSVTLGYGPEVGQQFSDCNPQLQSQLDAFVDSTINLTPPVTTTAPVTTTTAPVTTTAPPTTTDAQPPATTATVTTTVTTTIVDPTIDARLTALEQNYAQLAARVDAIAQANTAAWTAFIDATNAGASVSDAALAARSAGLNAIYQLG